MLETASGSKKTKSIFRLLLTVIFDFTTWNQIFSLYQTMPVELISFQGKKKPMAVRPWVGFLF